MYLLCCGKYSLLALLLCTAIRGGEPSEPGKGENPCPPALIERGNAAGSLPGKGGAAHGDPSAEAQPAAAAPETVLIPGLYKLITDERIVHSVKSLANQRRRLQSLSYEEHKDHCEDLCWACIQVLKKQFKATKRPPDMSDFTKLRFGDSARPSETISGDEVLDILSSSMRYRDEVSSDKHRMFERMLTNVTPTLPSKGPVIVQVEGLSILMQGYPVSPYSYEFPGERPKRQLSDNERQSLILRLKQATLEAIRKSGPLKWGNNIAIDEFRQLSFSDPNGGVFSATHVLNCLHAHRAAEEKDDPGTIRILWGEIPSGMRTYESYESEELIELRLTTLLSDPKNTPFVANHDLNALLTQKEIEHLAYQLARMYSNDRSKFLWPISSKQGIQVLLPQEATPSVALTLFVMNKIWPTVPAVEIAGLGPLMQAIEGEGMPERYAPTAKHVAIAKEQLIPLLLRTYQVLDSSGINLEKYGDCNQILLRDPTTHRTCSVQQLLVYVANVVPEIIRSDFSNANSVHKWLKAQIEGHTRQKTAKVETPETERADLDRFLEHNPSIRELVEAYADRPALLLEILEDLHPTEFEGRPVSDFILRYVGVHGSEVAARSSQRQVSRRQPGRDRLEYIRGLVAALERGERPGDPVTLQRPLDHLIRLNRPEFQVDPLATIQKLEEDSKHFAAMEQLDPTARDFLGRIHQAAADHFRSIHLFTVRNARSAPFLFEKEGAKFLVDRPGAILADEAGMGKTYQFVAAAESLGLNRILVVTPASNKNNIRSDILEHFQIAGDEVAVIDANNPASRKAQVAALGPRVRYIIINYEQVAKMYEKDRPTFDRLTNGLDALVVDEGHLVDNPQTDRAKALYAIQAPRKWVLSATPYQNKIERLYNVLHFIDPNAFPSMDFFVSEYTKDVAGLKRLHNRLQQYLLRRRKVETVEHFEDPSIRPYEEQLAAGGARLPKKVRISPEQGGSYRLLPEQSQILAAMTSDYEGWAKRFNSSRPSHVEPVPESVNGLQKFNLMHEVIYNPERFGIGKENPLYRALDRQVADRLGRGEKVILWAFNEAVLDAIQRRYHGFGVARFDGKMSLTEKDAARNAFQENPSVRILAANYRSGGVGLTLTAAHSAIYVQLPLQFAEYYQSEGRHHRVIGEANVRHAKSEVSVLWMVPEHDPGAVYSTTNPTAERVLLAGTLVEQTLRRLDGAELVYHLVLEGHANPEQVDRYLKGEVLRALTEAAPEPAAQVPINEVARRLQPLASRFSGKPADEEAVLQAISLLAKTPDVGVPIAREIEQSGQITIDDVHLIISIYQIRNSWIRHQVLSKLPAVLKRLRESGHSLAEEAKNLQVGRLTATDFLGHLLLHGPEAAVTKDIANSLLNLPANTPRTRYLNDRFNAAVVNLEGAPGEAWLAAHATELGRLALEDRINALYQAGLIARANPQRLSVGIPLADLSGELGHALATWIGQPSEEVMRHFSQNRNALEAAVALGVGYREHANPQLWEQYREALSHVTDGSYRDWRSKPGKQSGSHPTFLSDKPNWWAEFAKNGHWSFSRDTNSAQDLFTRFSDQLSRFQQAPGGYPEGEWVQRAVSAYHAATAAQRLKSREQLGVLQKELAVWIAEKDNIPPPVAEQIKRTFTCYGPIEPSNLKHLAKVQSDLQALASWLDMMDAKEAAKEGRPAQAAVPGLANSLTRLERFYRRSGESDIADELTLARQSLTASAAAHSTKITVEESDDPMLWLRQGELSEGLVNCFNQDGNPEFTQNVVTTLGSPHMKLFVAKDEAGNLLGVAVMKVKKADDGSPVLYLEQGMEARDRTAVRGALEQAVKAKAMGLSGLGIPTVGYTELGSAPPSQSRQVRGIGAFTEAEYVESVFGLRRSNNVRHRGRPIP
ncbi:MAG: DEAD/DEAH box helicase [Deltaproteobacteria bacterium]|nr:DEAD/DEAH box helicase [Deltaproteobacteria bacterium]